MKAEKSRLGRLASRILETRIKTRMLFLYLAGGALPMIFMGIYLVLGTNRILVEKEERTEIVELPYQACAQWRNRAAGQWAGGGVCPDYAFCEAVEERGGFSGTRKASWYRIYDDVLQL